MQHFPCRVCGQQLNSQPLLLFDNMPKAAQYLPNQSDLAEERGIDLPVHQCTSCGLIQLPIEPVPYHREVIRAAGISQVIRQEKHAQYAEFIKRHFLTGKKILEVGCGHGEFLSILNEFEVFAYGIEHADAAVIDCQSKGLAVEKGYPENHTCHLEAPFDAFLLQMFLEHMPNPNGALRSLQSILAPNAVGIVEVPNFDMVLNKGLFAEFIPDHLLYFTGKTLATTLELNGFELIELTTSRDDYVLSASVRRRPIANISALSFRQEDLLKSLDIFLATYGDDRVAIWGAGHQAFAILSLSGQSHRIDYVVDSAPFKQGRFTPATHRPIVAPSFLQTDPVDAVLVIAGSYSDEIAAILLDDPTTRHAVWQLRDNGIERVPRADSHAPKTSR